jgi:predicted esterase
MDRRRVLFGLASVALAACRRSGPTASREVTPLAPEGPWRELRFDAGADAPDGEKALLYAPQGSREWPLLVALHGRGESGRGLDVGAHGWRDDYAVERMHERLGAPPIAREHLEGFATDARLAQINASLTKTPFRGLRLATPYTPDLYDRSPEGAREFASFIADRLLPRCIAESGPLSREHTGIDGVSMGGRLALLVGFARPDLFSSIGALQPALDVLEAPEFALLAKAAMERARFTLRLVSSERDPFLPAVQALGESLTESGVKHDIVVVPGPHDYVWNRGPGSAEMLLFHERTLRGAMAP